MTKEIKRNTEPKEVAITHKFAAMLHSKTLTYGDMLLIMITIRQHSSKEDYEKLKKKLG